MRAAVGLVCLVPALWKCGDGPAGPDARRIPVRLVVAAVRDTIVLGDTLTLAATFLDSAGDTIPQLPLTWASSDTARAKVGSHGRVTAIAPGDVSIRASGSGLANGVLLSVIVRVASMTLPDTLTIGLFDTIGIAPLFWDPQGRRARSQRVIWSVVGSSLTPIADDMFASSVAFGTTSLVARCCNGLSDTTVVHVVPRPPVTLNWDGGTVSLFPDSTYVIGADPRDARDFPAPVTITWTSSDTSAVRVSGNPTNPLLGTVRVQRHASAVVTAAGGGLRASRTVRDGGMSWNLVLQPETLVIGVGRTGRLYPTVQTDNVASPHFGISVPPLLVDTSIAAMVSEYVVAGRAVGATRMALGFRDDYGYYHADTSVIVVQPPDPYVLAWSLPSAALDTLQLTQVTVSLTLTDTAGAAAAAVGDVVIASSDTAVVRPLATVVSGMNGVSSIPLLIQRPGLATVTATLGSLRGALWVNAKWSGARLTISAPALMQRGDSLDATVALTGIVTPGFPLSLSTSDSMVAAVHGRSTIVTRGVGIAVIRVSAGLLSDSVVILVRSSALPALAMAATPMHAGATATIIGTNFDPVPANNHVVVEDKEAAVMVASATSLTILVPSPESFKCRPQHRALLTVRTPAGLAADSVAFTPARYVPLAVSESFATTDTLHDRCLELPGSGAAYHIVATPVTRDPRTLVEYVLRNDTAGPATPAPSAAPVMPGIADRSTPLGPVVRTPVGARHEAVLEASRRFVLTHGSATVLLAARRGPARSPRDSVSGLVRMRAPVITDNDFCASYRTVTARPVFVGQHVRVLRDTSSYWPAGMDSVVAHLGNEFDAAMLPVIKTNFGDPLALDSLLDRDGRVTVLISPIVNNVAAGFVASCDFFPDDVAPSSNVGETIYLFAPEQAPNGFPGGGPGYWSWQARDVVAHELKHVAAFAERIRLGLEPEETWLEEGSAVVGEELWARRLFGNTWRGNAMYASTLYCEVRPGFPLCPPALGMLSAFSSLYDYGRSTSYHSPTGPGVPSDATYYGSAWALLRWATDIFATNESAFLRALIMSPETGTANLEARTGKSYQELVSTWLRALTLDDGGLPGAPSFPSWNLRSIYGGLNQEFSSAFPSEYPFTASRFVAEGIWGYVVRGGGANLHYLGTTTEREFLRVGSNASRSPVLVTITRIQ